MTVRNLVYLEYFPVTQEGAMQKEVKEIVGKRIISRRTALEMTQAKLVELAGIDQQQLSRYEKGQSMPTLTSAIKLARALQCSIPYLIGQDEEPNPPEPLSGLTDDERFVLTTYQTRIRALQEEVINEAVSIAQEPFRRTVSVLLRQILQREGKFNNLGKKT